MTQEAIVCILRHLSIIYYLLTINCEALTLHRRRCQGRRHQASV